MSELVKYPFPHGSITKSDAIKFTAKVVYPDMVQVSARKIVRDRMNYPTKQGLLPKTLSIDAGEFFKWAITNMDWNGRLMQVEGLPIAPIHGSINAVLPALTCEAFGHQVITDPIALEAAYSDLMMENYNLKKEIQIKDDTIRLLQNEVDFWRHKDEEKRRKCSKAGSRPKWR